MMFQHGTKKYLNERLYQALARMRQLPLYKFQCELHREIYLHLKTGKLLNLKPNE